MDAYPGSDLPGQHCPVGARFGAALQYARFRVAQNDLTSAKADGIGHFDDVVAPACQRKR